MGHTNSDSYSDGSRNYSAYGWVIFLVVIIIAILIIAFLFNSDSDHKKRHNRHSAYSPNHQSPNHRSHKSHPQSQRGDDYDYYRQNGSSRFNTNSAFEVQGDAVYEVKLPTMLVEDGESDDPQFKYNMNIQLHMTESYPNQNEDGQSYHLQRENSLYPDHFNYDSYMEPCLTPVNVKRQSKSGHTKVEYQATGDGLLINFKVDPGVELQCSLKAEIYMILEPRQQLGRGFSISECKHESDEIYDEADHGPGPVAEGPEEYQYSTPRYSEDDYEHSKKSESQKSSRDSKRSSHCDSKRSSHRDSKRSSHSDSKRSSRRDSKSSSHRDSKRSSRRDSDCDSKRSSHRDSDCDSKRSSRRDSDRKSD